MKMTTIFGAALIALTFASCTNQSEQTEERPTQSIQSAQIPEGYIISDTANEMISSFLTSIESDTAYGTNVHSFILDAALLRHYLTNQEIVKVKVMLAHTLDYINTGGEGKYAGFSSDALTIVLAGYDTAGNYIYTEENMVPNQATPCPRNCPQSGTAAEDLLN